MFFHTEAAWLMGMGLTAVRLGVLFYATPLDLLGRLPARIRVPLIFIFAVILTLALELKLSVLPGSAVEFVLMVLYECGKGLVLVLGIYMAFGVFMLAGQLLDSQAGFAAASVLNPTTHTREPMMGVALQWLAVVLFFLLEAHHLLIEAIAWSFTVAPIGVALGAFSAELAVRQFGFMFVYGLIMAAPVLVGLLIVDTGVAMMSRTMPQINIYFVSLPLKVFLGLWLISLSLKYLLPVVEKVFTGIFVYWSRVL